MREVIKFVIFTKKILKIVDKSNKPHIQVMVGGEQKMFAPEEIYAIFLAKMKEIAESNLGHKIEHAVVTVPAYFNDSGHHRGTERCAHHR